VASSQVFRKIFTDPGQGLQARFPFAFTKVNQPNGSRATLPAGFLPDFLPAGGYHFLPGTPAF